MNKQQESGHAKMANEPQKQTLWDTIKSVAAAFFGVQSRANRERDFTHGNPVHFIVVGLLMTVLFVVLVVFGVQFLLRDTGL